MAQRARGIVIRDDRAEPCTRAGAVDAGWRFAGQHAGEAMVLQHSGVAGQRWQLRASSLEFGFAVAEYKRYREYVVNGAVALWHNGRINRFDAAADLHRTGT
jgi:hypothetical protein